MRLTDATWTEVRDTEAEIALLPVGSTEQHGPHAPLGTDTLHAETVAETAAERYEATASNRKLLVTPAIPVGISEEHRSFDGTLWVSPETFRGFVRETAQSLADHGIKALILVNGHGGNTPALGEVAARLSRDGIVRTVAFTWFDAVGEHTTEMGHGGKLETALLRHSRPDLLREDRLEEARSGGSQRWGRWVAGVNLAHDTDEFTENGVVGDPLSGDADLGERLLEKATDALLEVVGALEDGSEPAGPRA